MITIPIQVSGDVWNNRAQVKEILEKTVTGQSVMLDLCSEGPSLSKLGILELVNQYQLDVWITRWCNSVESVPYKKQDCNHQSHFFPLAGHYWTHEIEHIPMSEYRFGLFLGRSTTARNCILYDCMHRWPDQFLASKLKNTYCNAWATPLDDQPIEAWVDNTAHMQTWFESASVPSIEDYNIQDQYIIPEVSSAKMMSGLINNHYPRFNVELVCETYTLGNAFFPTEKTVRPIVGNKPFIVYGPRGFLNNLQTQEGFRTFGDVWDESYDLLEGPARWKAIAKLIDTLASQCDERWNDTISQVSTITRHNRNILEKIINARKKL